MISGEQSLATALGKLRSPGYQYAFCTADGTIEPRVGGVARVPDAPMTAATTFNAYSVAKTLTAAAVLLLAERGALALDAPLQDYLELSVDRRPTLRQALGHTAGFRNPLPLAWAHPVGEHAGFDRSAFVRATLSRHSQLRARPGQSVAYSNVGYLLLGEVVERVSGQAFTEFVEREMLPSLALPAEAVLAFTVPDLARHASGHIPRFGALNLLMGCFVERKRLVGEASGRWQRMRAHYANGAAFGGLIANAAGLIAYLRALLAGEWPSANVNRQLFEPVRTAAGTSTRRTLGWFRGELFGRAYYTHAGGGAAYYCEARLYPHLGCASALMLNRAGLSDARMLDAIDSAWVRSAR